MIGFNVLRNLDPMLSFDVHSTIVPPSPAPFPSIYFHPSFLGHGVIAEKSKMSSGPSFTSLKLVKTGYQFPMLQGTCCGFFDVHIGILTNVLLPLTLAFSSSKSLFVSGTVTTNGANVACGVLVFMNMNLNCAFPVSLPIGVVYAFNTVKAGMSIGDIIAGVVTGALQMAVEFVAGKALGGAARLPISRSLNSSLGDMGSRMFARVVNSSRISDATAAALAAYAPEVGEQVLGGLQGIALDNTPIEDALNTATTRWIGSDPRDVF